MPGLVTGRKVLPMSLFDLQRMPEALHRRVVVAIGGDLVFPARLGAQPHRAPQRLDAIQTRPGYGCTVPMGRKVNSPTLARGGRKAHQLDVKAQT